MLKIVTHLLTTSLLIQDSSTMSYPAKLCSVIQSGLRNQQVLIMHKSLLKPDCTRALICFTLSPTLISHFNWWRLKNQG